MFNHLSHQLLAAVDTHGGGGVREVYLSCNELFQPFYTHSSPQHSSDGGEARVIPEGRGTSRKWTRQQKNV